MNEKFTLTGGARIGKANASYPFAKLEVDKNVLKIDASIVGNLIFQAKDIIELKPYKSIPVIGNGIKIIHRIENYSSEVIFWTFKDPNFVLKEIERTGFLSNTNSILSENDLEIIKKQGQGSFPIKKSAVIFFVVIWNLLLLWSFIPIFTNPQGKGFPIGIGANIALGFIFLSSILALISKSFRTLILKEGRDFEDIKKFLYLLILVTGMLFLSFTVTRLNF